MSKIGISNAAFKSERCHDLRKLHNETQNVGMYRGYFGNLRLWSVQELVSRYDFGQSKAYTMK